MGVRSIGMGVPLLQVPGICVDVFPLKWHLFRGHVNIQGVNLLVFVG